ncbi:Ribokinase [Saliniradius amylolyticus]|uniref:Ribokinase n=1 Tax=Saliniradius amylolyticus TaxID=2183582 RepID=A0A2S2E5Q1_9ALTE|nr:adenosine kinase [Saliniradius amylolyticus]AWL12984.1 Ribokinase [Saliniradius amylolyticus]
MANYDVVALGNALVDKEFLIDDAFLAQQGIEKGVMTLFESEQQQALLDSLYKSYPLRKKAGGGSAANSMVTLAQFGGRPFYCCKVGNDELGQFYQQDLSEAGVAHRLESQDTPGETGKCVVLITNDAERTMCTHLGITTDFSTQELHREVLEAAQYLYIEGHLVYSPAAVEAILEAKQLARQAGIKIALTISDPAVVKYAREHLEQVLGEDGVDLLFCNQDEVTDFGKDGGFEAGLVQLQQLSPVVVVTQGKQGATVYHGQEQVAVQAYPVKPVDTTGAGDTFAGAFLYGITHGMDYAQAGDLASRSAAECVANFGPRLSRKQQDAILTQYQS